MSQPPNVSEPSAEPAHRASATRVRSTDTSLTELILTTNPGLEDIVIAEFDARLEAAELSSASFEAKPEGLNGRVQVKSPDVFADLWPVAESMRSIHHIHRPVTHFTIDSDEPLLQIRQNLAGLDIREMVDATAFRVTSKRQGTHDFTSVDVQRAAGAGVVDRYNCKVDLTNFDTNVRVDVDDTICSVMVQLTHEPLNNRYAYEYRPKVALKTNMAFAMLVLAGVYPDGIPPPAQIRNISEQETSESDSGNDDSGSEQEMPLSILDPFCGSGTIPIEAAACLPAAQIYANERFDRPYKWTQDNLAALKLTERVALNLGDARNIDEHYPAESIDVIVTNPPFGAQLGQETNFFQLYRSFLQAAAPILKPDGRLVMLVWKRSVFNKVVQQVGWKILHARVVDQGGIFPGIFVLKQK